MKSWYDRVKKDLLVVGAELKSPDTTQEERVKLYKEMTDLVVELDDIFVIIDELLKH